MEKEEQLAGQAQSEVQQCSLVVFLWVSGLPVSDLPVVSGLPGQCSGCVAALTVSETAPGAGMLFSI